MSQNSTLSAKPGIPTHPIYTLAISSEQEMLEEDKCSALLHDSEDIVCLTIKSCMTEDDHKNKSRRLSILAPASVSLELQNHCQRFKSKVLTDAQDDYRKTKAAAGLLLEEGDANLVELITKWREAFLLALPELTEIYKDAKTGYSGQYMSGEREVVGSDVNSSQCSQQLNENNTGICNLIGATFEGIEFDPETNEFKDLDQL